MKRFRCSICRRPSVTCEQRVVTNVPLQKLFFLNSDTVAAAVGSFGRSGSKARVRMKAITAAYRLLWQSAANRERTAAWAAHFCREREPISGSSMRRVLLSSNEFAYVD